MRFSESNTMSPGQIDFLPRQRRDQMRGVIALAVVAILSIFLLIMVPSSAGGKNWGAAGAMLTVAAFCIYITYRKQKNLDLLMSTEYQNMLFAQAASLGCSFCLFARRDGSIVYASDSLRTLFPNFKYSNAMALEGVFNESNVSKNDRDRLMNAIASGVSDRLVFPVRLGSGQEKEYVLSIEPLPRPTGFAVIRAREFLESRTGVQMLPDMLRTTSAEKIDHLLRTSSFAQYTADAYGRVEYANPTMETLLEYAPGSLSGSNISLSKLFFELQGNPVPDDYTITEHHSEAVLQKKGGNLIKVTLEQHLMRDNDGKIVGAVGCIMPNASRN